MHDSSSISITASVSTASDIHLTPDTRHNKDAQNTTTAIPQEGVLVERQSKKKKSQQQQQSTSRKQTLLQARVFSLSQEVSINLMAALVRQSVTQQLEWRK